MLEWTTLPISAQMNSRAASLDTLYEQLSSPGERSDFIPLIGITYRPILDQFSAWLYDPFAVRPVRGEDVVVRDGVVQLRRDLYGY